MEGDQKSYVTDHEDPYVWANSLQNCGCDEASMKDWFVLAGASKDGWTEAMSILHKLLKRSHSGYPYDKPSAVVCSSVKNAWHKISE